jgi:hypothetical protein
MKKIFIVLPAILLIFISFGCSDDSTSTQKNVVTITDIQRKPDTLSIYFDIQNTTFSMTDTASELQFSGIPKVIYEIRPTSGSGDFTLFNGLDSNIYYRYFTVFISDSNSLASVPWRYSFNLSNFTGNGRIKVVR